MVSTCIRYVFLFRAKVATVWSAY